MKIVFRYLVPLFLCLIFVGGFLLLATATNDYELEKAIHAGARIIAGALLMSAALRGLTQGRRQGGE